MKDTQENKYSMYLAVKQVLMTYSTVWGVLQAFVTSVGVFTAKLDRISALVVVQTTPSTGVRKDKLLALEVMVERAVEVAGAVFAYATDVNNQTLRDIMDLSETDLRQVRDSLAVERARSIHDSAAPLVGLLGDYGVTVAELGGLNSAVNAFALSIPQPRVVITVKKGATTELRTVMKDVDGILEDRLDKLMPRFKASAPEFYDNYFNARIIVDSGAAHRRAQLQVTVMMDGTMLPVNEALVTFSPKGKRGLTDLTGRLLLTAVRPGNGKVTVTKTGLVTKAVDVVLVNDELVELTVLMVAA